METYSTISGDYQMFEDKMPVNSENAAQPSEEEMIRYMFKILTEYNRSISEGQEPAINPLNGRVTMQLSNGQVYEIPEKLQRFSIARYMQAVNAANQQQVGAEAQRPTFRRRADEDIDVVKKDVESKKFMNIVSILLIAAIVYLLYKYFTKNDDNDLDF